MIPVGTDNQETVRADLELTGGLAIQMTALSTPDFLITVGLLGGLFQVVTGRPASFQFAPAGVGWWTSAVDILVLLLLATVIPVPHELLHGLAIRHYGSKAKYGVGIAHFILP